MSIEELQNRTEEALSKGATDVYVTGDCDLTFVATINGQSKTLETIDESDLLDPNE